MSLTIYGRELKGRLIAIADDLRRASAVAAQSAAELTESYHITHYENLQLVRKILIEDKYFLLSCVREISEGIIIKVPKADSRND